MDYAIKINGQYESIPFYSNVIQTEGNGTIYLQVKVGDNNYTPYKNIRRNNTVTKLDMPNDVTYKLVSRQPFNYTIPGIEPKYMNKHKIEDYLYEITYGNIDYDYAYRYFIDQQPSGCSAIRNGNWFGRNFDWLYNNQVQFVVNTSTSLNRYGVIGVSGIIPGVEQSNVDDDTIIIDGIDMFKLIPFYLLDGINEKGLFCTHNIVPLDDEITPTIEITAKKREIDRVSIPMLTRFILDRFATVDSALDYIINYTTVFFTDDMIDSGYQSHFMIGDTHNTVIVEFINNEIVVMDHNYITNFNIANAEFENDGTILYPPTQYGIQKYGMGLERWDIIVKSFKTANTFNGIKELMEKLKYSNCYNEPFWYSEIVKGIDDNGDIITVDTDSELCTSAKTMTIEAYESRDRDNPTVWITNHSSVYDIKKKILYINNQENNKTYSFILQ